MSSRDRAGHKTEYPGEVVRAHESLERLRARVQDDPTRPRFHFVPPAGWMNDPNGTMWHNGHYHLFYQHNPYDDVWENIHWGHARSKDLVDWEYLPIALAPTQDGSVSGCFSGSATVTPAGDPTLFFTKVGRRPEHEPREQWVATSDESMLRWRPSERNPILSLRRHGGPEVLGDWRDPYVFTTEGRHFLLLGATLTEADGGDFVVLLYESTDDHLLEWEFKSVLIKKPGYELSFFECPNFVQFADRWLLLTSPYTPVEYYSGKFDVSSYAFTPQLHGRLDVGMDFYATNTANAPDGRTILFGWVRGFRKKRGWSGCLALPRELSVDADGRPIQKPIAELEALRQDEISVAACDLTTSEVILGEGRDLSCAEVECAFIMGSAFSVEIRIRRASDGRGAVSILYDGHVLEVQGTKTPYERVDSRAPIELRIFIDRSVLEVFVDRGKRTITKVAYVPDADCGVSIRTLGGSAVLTRMVAWPLRDARKSYAPGVDLAGFPATL